MTALVVLTLILVGVLGIAWAISSTSQAWASARQAQAAIEAGRAAHAASLGNLVAIIVIALLVIVLLGVLAWALYLRWKLQNPPRRWQPGPNAQWGKVKTLDGSPQSALPPSASVLDALVQLETLKVLSQYSQGHQYTPAPGGGAVAEENLPQLESSSWDA